MHRTLQVVSPCPYSLGPWVSTGSAVEGQRDCEITLRRSREISCCAVLYQAPTSPLPAWVGKMGSAPTATNGERKNMSNEEQENCENPGGGQLRRSLLSSRWFRVLGASALLVGFAAGGFGIASATTSSGGTSTAGAARSVSGWGHQTGQLRGRHSPPAAAGKVESVTAGSVSGTGTFTVKGRDGKTVTVEVSSSTTYKDPGVTSPSFANVTTGEMVSVEGTTASSGVVTATSVFIGFGGGMGHDHGHRGGFATGWGG